ncbi:MAG: hypothetical protein V4710_03530 [Verrucomicrobiota bacterium]
MIRLPVSLLFTAISFLFLLRLPAADAVFSADGKRVWYTVAGIGSIGYLDISGHDGATSSDRLVDISRTGGPKVIQGLAISRTGNLLIAAPDAIWAFNPATTKTVRVATLPAGFNASDLAYEESTGAILVWGVFLAKDHTVRLHAAYRIAKDTNRCVPVLISGIGSWQSAAFDNSGHLFLGSGPDLWGGVLVPNENDPARQYPWQIHAFRLAALGTPVTGEGVDATQILHGIGGGVSLWLTMRGPEGSTLVRIPRPALTKTESGIDRLLSLADRWAFQQKLISSAQFASAENALPRLPIVAVNADGSRVVYQTADAGLRRWWLLEKEAKPRLLIEESD